MYISEGLVFKYLYDINPSRPDPGRIEKINLKFCFQVSFWWLKRFYQGFEDTTKKYENKNLF